ncbi:MAG: transketolase C-terminal domain-containing protein [Acidobacteriota bacterium]
MYIVVADISPAASTAAFRNDFPEQFINVGVAEQSMISLCAGLALRGCRPFAYTIATFTIYRPFEQVRIDLCYQELPVTLVGVGAGLQYSTLGGTHHAQEDVALMSALPNMAVIAPCDPQETAAAVWACAERQGPTYLRLGKAGEPNLTSGAVDPFHFGKVRRLKEGRDVCILSYGPITRLAFSAAEQMEAVGAGQVGVVSVHTLKPLDKEGLAGLLARYQHVVVVEEHSVQGGLGAQVKQIAWESGATCRLSTFALQDAFIHQFGSPEDLWRAHGISVPAMVEAVTKARC